MLLVAVVEGELVLVEEVGDVLLDRVTGAPLDPAGMVLLGLEVERVLEPAA